MSHGRDPKKQSTFLDPRAVVAWWVDALAGCVRPALFVRAVTTKEGGSSSSGSAECRCMHEHETKTQERKQPAEGKLRAKKEWRRESRSGPLCSVLADAELGIRNPAAAPPCGAHGPMHPSVPVVAADARGCFVGAARARARAVLELDCPASARDGVPTAKARAHGQRPRPRPRPRHDPIPGVSTGIWPGHLGASAMQT
jgi:hypothetical protein